MAEDETEQTMPEEGEVQAVQGTDKQAYTWGMLCHLAALAGFIGIPFGNVIGPLVIWLIKKDEFAFVDDNGKESLNFQISVTICALVAAILIVVVIGIFLLIALAVADLVFIIMAAVKASKGETYRYPLSIKFLK